MKEISAVVKDSLKSVDFGNNVVRQVGTVIEGVGDEVSEVAQRIRSLSDLLQQQRAATSEVAHNVTLISEKANKTKDEVEAIDRRLRGCQDIVQQTLDAGCDCPADKVALVRLPADATAWKRVLAGILLGTGPAPETSPVLSAMRALTEAEEHCKSHSADHDLLTELSAAINAAQQNASQMVAEVRKSNWAAATPPYIACEEALKTAIAVALKLSNPDASHNQSRDFGC